MEAVKRLGIFARLNLKKISCSKEELEVRYISQIIGGSEKDILQDYKKKLSDSSLKEKERGFTLVGPHRDSLMFFLNNKPANKFASTGQRKSIGMALKLAEAENMRSFSPSEPAFLLDEIFNELDEERRNQLYSMLCRKNQVLCTTTEKKIVEEIASHKKTVRTFYVTGGTVKKV